MKCHLAGVLALTLFVAPTEFALQDGQQVAEVSSFWPTA